jgi:hypothetical protein
MLTKQEEKIVVWHRNKAFAAKHREQTMLKATFAGCKSQSNTSIDMKDQEQTEGQSPFEDIVPLWLFVDIVCQVEIES